MFTVKTIFPYKLLLYIILLDNNKNNKNKTIKISSFILYFSLMPHLAKIASKNASEKIYMTQIMTSLSYNL